ncbi:MULTISPECIES: hypothetical protein [Providencia]|nr:hypothetical protein [Providencia vermicola]MTB40786.1 hypothetical protein [Providencia sp. wls1949]
MNKSVSELKCCDCGNLFSKNIVSINKDINICFDCVFALNNRVSSFVIANNIRIKYDKAVETMIARYKNYKIKGEQ